MYHLGISHVSENAQGKFRTPDLARPWAGTYASSSMIHVTRDTSLAQLQEIVKTVPATRGERPEFVRSVQQSLRVEGYALSEAEVSSAVKSVLYVST